MFVILSITQLLQEGAVISITILLNNGATLSIVVLLREGAVPSMAQKTDRRTDIATYRLNWPRGQFNKNLKVTFSCSNFFFHFKIC